MGQHGPESTISFIIKLLLLILALLAHFTFWGQNSNGYYITKTGDTVRGKILVPILPKTMRYKAYFESLDPLKEVSTNELKTIDYPKLLFDFKFSEDGKEFKKYDRLDVNGFGFTYENHDYNFITWDVKANKQLYFMSGAGDIAPNGVYFILRSLEGQIPIYSLFWEKEQFRRTSTPSPSSALSEKVSAGFLRQREIIFHHPTRGFLYMSTQYPMRIKKSQLYDYLELEPEFRMTLKKKEYH